MRQAISPRLAIRIFLNIRDAPQRPCSNRAVLLRGHRAGSITGSGVSKARATVEHCTVPADFVINLLPTTCCIRLIQLQATCIPERPAEASMSVSHEPLPYQHSLRIWRDLLRRRWTPALRKRSRFYCSLPGSQSVDRLGTALRNNSTPFRSLSTTVPAFCKATVRQRTIRSNQGIGQRRRACRSDNREHAPSDEIRAVSVRAPNADRFRRPRRAGFSASPVAER